MDRRYEDYSSRRDASSGGYGNGGGYGASAAAYHNGGGYGYGTQSYASRTNGNGLGADLREISDWDLNALHIFEKNFYMVSVTFTHHPISHSLVLFLFFSLVFDSPCWVEL